jgi:hypothetical protein
MQQDVIGGHVNCPTGERAHPAREHHVRLPSGDVELETVKPSDSTKA